MENDSELVNVQLSMRELGEGEMVQTIFGGQFGLLFEQHLHDADDSDDGEEYMHAQLVIGGGMTGELVLPVLRQLVGLLESPEVAVQLAADEVLREAGNDV